MNLYLSDIFFKMFNRNIVKIKPTHEIDKRFLL